MSASTPAPFEPTLPEAQGHQYPAFLTPRLIQLIEQYEYYQRSKIVPVVPLYQQVTAQELQLIQLYYNQRRGEAQQTERARQTVSQTHNQLPVGFNPPPLPQSPVLIYLPIRPNWTINQVFSAAVQQQNEHAQHSQQPVQPNPYQFHQYQIFTIERPQPGATVHESTNQRVGGQIYSLQQQGHRRLLDFGYQPGDYLWLHAAINN